MEELGLYLQVALAESDSEGTHDMRRMSCLNVSSAQACKGFQLIDTHVLIALAILEPNGNKNG